jgi:hypothetical protein
MAQIAGLDTQLGLDPSVFQVHVGNATVDPLTHVGCQYYIAESMTRHVGHAWSWFVEKVAAGYQLLTVLVWGVQSRSLFRCR